MPKNITVTQHFSEELTEDFKNIVQDIKITVEDLPNYEGGYEIRSFVLPNEISITVDDKIEQLKRVYEDAKESAILKAVNYYLGTDWSYGFTKKMLESGKLKLKTNDIHQRYSNYQRYYTIFIKDQRFAEVRREFIDYSYKITTEYFVETC